MAEQSHEAAKQITELIKQNEVNISVTGQQCALQCEHCSFGCARPANAQKESLEKG